MVVTLDEIVNITLRPNVMVVSGLIKKNQMKLLHIIN